MTLTTAEQVRLRIQDQAKPADIVRYGDGTAARFALDHRNITTASAFVASATQAGWSATAGAAFNISGYVEFSSVISANTAFRMTYVYSVFSDAEIGNFTAVGGNVNGAALEAVRALRFDGLRRARWAGADGTQYDDTAALAELGRLEAALLAEREQDSLSGGVVQAWGETQEDYS